MITTRRQLMHESLQSLAEEMPFRPALQYEYSHFITYDELNKEANRLARALSGRGVVSQQKVLMYLGRGIEQVVVLFALWKIGAIYVPGSTEQPLSQLKEIIRDCKIVNIITVSFLAQLLGVE